MKLRRAGSALLALTLTVAGSADAQPVASLPSGFTFVDWLSTGRTETVGIGSVDTRDVVYYIKEKAVAGFQSWYIFFDPSGTQSVNGSITFDQSIAALYTSTADMLSSGATYQLASGVTYGSATATGLEGPDAASYAGNSLSINFVASDPGDHIRVLTAVADPSTVPEPAGVALLAAGMLGLVVVGGRKRRV
jgi:hypothetical protein